MNNIFSIPPAIQSILRTLEQAGHPAYLVGGCVRNYLLGIPPEDFDICTRALPQQTMELFPHSIPTGIAHGTVTVLYDGVQAEVTTFREETGYSDHRHPDAVCFTRDLNQDLARRDFTVNAIAMDLRGVLYDPYGGQADLERKRLRCVGEPDRRFREDALRMLRGLRFQAQLGFQLDPDTLRSMERNAPYSRYVARERVQTELTKTLLSPRPQVVGELIRLGLLEDCLPPRPLPDLSPLGTLPPEKALRYACLLFLLEVEDPQWVLRQLKLDKATIYAAGAGVRAARQGLPSDAASMKQLLRREGESAADCCCACGDYETLSRLKEQVLQRGEPYRMQDLAIGGKDLQAMGIHGVRTGQTLNHLLDQVIRCPQLNRPDTLRELALAYYGESGVHGG